VGDAGGAHQALDEAYRFTDPVVAGENLPADLPAEYRQQYLLGRHQRVMQQDFLFLLRAGSHEQIRQRLEQEGIMPGNIPPWVSYSVQVRLAQYWIETGKAREGVTLLEQLYQQASSNCWLRDEISILVKLSVGYAALGEKQQARELIRRAVGKGAAEGFLRCFITAGEKVAELLAEMAEWGAAAELEFVSQVRAFFARGIEKTAPGKQALIEPLTEREADILRLLATDRTYQEMAEVLYLSINTVKTHVKRLYARLGVDSRMAAVDTGRSRGYIR
jgi:LuxR family maltose regulon positive regulatory protein